MTHKQSRSEAGTSNKKLFSITVTCLLFVGAFVRFWNLADFPQQVHNDESNSIVEGIMHFTSEGRGGWALFGSAFGGHPNLSYWLNALPSRVLGEVSLWSSRLGSATAGTLSLVILTLFVVKAYGRRVGIIFLVFIIPYAFHVHFSRTAFPYVYALLGMAVVSYAFVGFLKNPSKRSALITGVMMGLAALAYPATHVLPAAIAAAVVLSVWPDLIKKKGAARGSVAFVTMSLSFILGVIITLTPHLIYTYKYGYTSRLTQTLIFHEHNLRHLGPQTGDPKVTTAGIVWFNMKRTAMFFYSGDTGEQYQFHENPFPLWGAALAALGALVMVAKAFRRDPVAIYLVVTAIATFVASGLMVEGNFSPHLLLFAVITPLGMALAFDKLLNWIRIRHVALVTVVTGAVGLLWAHWNWEFYNRVVSTERSRLTRAVTYLLRLPINTREVRTIIGAAGVEVYPHESYYKVMYPQSQQFKLADNAPAGEIARLVTQGGGPAVVIENEGEAGPLQQELEKMGKKVEKITRPQFPAVFLYVQ